MITLIKTDLLKSFMTHLKTYFGITTHHTAENLAHLIEAFPSTYTENIFSPKAIIYSSSQPKCTFYATSALQLIYAPTYNSIIDLSPTSSLHTLVAGYTTIPSSYIGNNTNTLTTLALPACTTIGADAFKNCTHLTEVHIGTSNCTLGTHAFDNTPALSTIYVPSTYLSWYQSNSTWAPYSNRLMAEPEA